jgi:hypothetical protein
MHNKKGWLMLLTLAVVAFVFALKAVVNKRRKGRETQNNNDEGLEL